MTIINTKHDGAAVIAEYLIAQRYTDGEHLGIMGGSKGEGAYPAVGRNDDQGRQTKPRRLLNAEASDSSERSLSPARTALAAAPPTLGVGLHAVLDPRLDGAWVLMGLVHRAKGDDEAARIQEKIDVVDAVFGDKR